MTKNGNQMVKAWHQMYVNITCHFIVQQLNIKKQVMKPSNDCWPFYGKWPSEGQLFHSNQLLSVMYKPWNCPTQVLSNSSYEEFHQKVENPPLDIASLLSLSLIATYHIGGSHWLLFYDECMNISCMQQ
jgi:hypothetical protein